MLLANNLKFKRFEKIIFENIQISASSGKIIFIRGNNGSGKTTLIKTLAKILEPIEGEIDEREEDRISNAPTTVLAEQYRKLLEEVEEE